MKYRVRLVAKPGDISASTRAALNALDGRLFPEDELYPKDGCYWWLALDGDEPVGFAGLRPLVGHDKGTAFLCRAGVLPRAAGAGLQRRLIRVRLRHARAVGMRSVITYTSRYNFRSVVNLIRAGMRLYLPKYAWGVSGAWYFVADTEA